jgi:hypothetical protein
MAGLHTGGGDRCVIYTADMPIWAHGTRIASNGGDDAKRPLRDVGLPTVRFVAGARDLNPRSSGYDLGRTVVYEDLGLCEFAILDVTDRGAIPSPGILLPSLCARLDPSCNVCA